jgi:HAD superfamily phosphoserine phosphatase-like hydrolase
LTSPPHPDHRDFILVDFDGTLAAADVGNRFFHRFATDGAAWRRVIDDWKQGRATARECLARECELARVSEEEARAFVRSFHLVPEAQGFAAAARAAGHDLAVASDGLSFYIEDLLERAGVSLPHRANRLRFEGAGPVPAFGSRGPSFAMAGGRVAAAAADAGPGCGACGNCKGAAFAEARASGRYRRLVLVGDGYSDRCGARAADVRYAKDDLLAWCGEQGLGATPFTTLDEVVRAEGWPICPPSPRPL